MAIVPPVKTTAMRATRRCYRLRTEPLREIDEWISPYRQLWVDRLDALERHLETMERDEPMDRHSRR
jgi:hypothetical protein